MFAARQFAPFPPGLTDRRSRKRSIADQCAAEAGDGAAAASSSQGTAAAAPGTPLERLLAPRAAAAPPASKAGAGSVSSVPVPRSEEPFRQDEFLRVPVLFKHGPWLLLVMGALLSASFYLAAYWRIDAGRHGVYLTALQFAETTAGAARESSSQVLGRLRQATHNLEALGNHDDAAMRLAEAFASGLGLRADGIEALAVSGTGSVSASTVPLPLATAFARRIGALARTAPHGAPLVLPAATGLSSGRTLVPVIHRVELPNDVQFLVYLVDATLFTAVANKAFGQEEGWLRIEDEYGRSLLETSTWGRMQTKSESLEMHVSSADEAMRSRMDYDSPRLLVAATDPSPEGLTVLAGVREANALKWFKPRVDATWLIAGFASALLMGLVCLTALALRKFAVKERYLRRLATVDILTSLPNRRSFNHLLGRRVEESKRSSRPFALYFVDLDNFKYVNDSLGHEAGDALLRNVAEVLTRAVGREGRVSRLGGDEFTVLMPGIGDIESAQRFGKSLVTALRASFDIQGVEVQPRASIGAALMPLHASSASDLMRFADTAMYRAKQDGKGCCVVYGEAMAAQNLSKASAVREIEQGLARNEFYLVYQPKFLTVSGDLSGFEALVRWQHPRRGIVCPGEFIGLAEESGLIADLGDFVLERAVRQVRQWHDEGAGWHQVAVNVSQLQLRGKDFATRVRSLLDRFQVPGRYLQLELTETSLAVDTANAQALVHALRGLGVSVAVDDFGTGYSSMGALQRFELDCLKVDRSFVNVLHTTHGQEICRAVISLGHALNMRVIAEGVETADQAKVLARLGCDEVQGYLYSMPVSPSEAIAHARGGAAAHAAGGRMRPLVAYPRSAAMATC